MNSSSTSSVGSRCLRCLKPNGGTTAGPGDGFGGLGQAMMSSNNSRPSESRASESSCSDPEVWFVSSGVCRPWSESTSLSSASSRCVSTPGRDK